MGRGVRGSGDHDPEGLARRIREAVRTQTRLTCCVGIGDNLLRAKTATGFAKPPVRSEHGAGVVGAGVFTLTAQNWDVVMGDRPARALWGIGAKTAAKLADRGLHTVRELAGADPAALAADLGPALGPWYVQLGRGVGRVEVRGEPWLARSRGHEETFAVDLTDWAEVRAAAAGLARRVAADVLAEGRLAARVGVKVRFVPFITRTRSTTLAEPTSDMATIEATALDMLDQFTARRPVRLVGVRADFAPELRPRIRASPTAAGCLRGSRSLAGHGVGCFSTGDGHGGARSLLGASPRRAAGVATALYGVAGAGREAIVGDVALDVAPV